MLEDLYLVLAGWTGGGSAATVKVFINPLASFLWLGGLIFLTGGAVAMWPSARAVRLPIPQARRRAVRNSIGLAVGLLILLAAGLAMWGPGHGAAAQSSGRPLPGQPAPDFTLDLVDGSQFTLSDLRGQVAVVNFWATWCPPCEEELPRLQAVWDEYQEEGVAFVGVVYQDQMPAVQGAIARFGLTYPVGLDGSERIANSYGITGVPETFVIDREGQVAYLHIGPVGSDELTAEIEDLLSQ
jgi:cytochrome c biogenesis protein CcmG/thiol:disulfide interchange protein DsbE